MSTLIEANTQFSVNLFKVLAEENPTQNIFFSPLSISAALAMVYYGARGDTAKQMERALHLDKITESGSSSLVTGVQCDQPRGIHSQFKALLAAINEHTQNYALSIVNRLYGGQQYRFLQVTGVQCDQPRGIHSQFKALLAAINEHTQNYALSIVNRLYGGQQYRFLQDTEAQRRFRVQCDQPRGIHSLFKALLAVINQHTQNYALSIANRLYGAQQYEFLQQYVRYIKDVYDAELERVDFEQHTEEVRKKINSWVESQRNGKIKELFPPCSIDASSVLILVNAIYFKGKWKREFNRSNTKEGLFWINQNESKNVQMMHQTGVFSWAQIKNPKIQVLELPYDQGDISMLILLPGDIEGLDQLQRELTYEKIKEWTRPSNMKKEELMVLLPKFKFEELYELPPALKVLGMEDVFQRGKADLTGMSENQNIFITGVVHKAYVEVNEEGTEAAAATGAVVGATATKPAFRVDHPFFFFIRQNETKTILFMGIFCTP